MTDLTDVIMAEAKGQSKAKYVKRQGLRKDGRAVNFGVARPRNDVPYTQLIPQPRWDERYGHQKTRKLTNQCKIGGTLKSEAFKCWLSQFSQTRRFENEYSISATFKDNARCTFALVGRHSAGQSATTAALTNLPKYGLFPALNNEIPYLVEAAGDGIKSFWSNYNANFYESQSLQMASSLPGLTNYQFNSHQGLRYYNITDQTDKGNAAMSQGFGAVSPHDKLQSPFTDLLDNMVNAGEQWMGNGAMLQRHESGGMKVNITNSSDYPMACDIIVFKCKSNAKGDDLGIGAAVASDPLTPGTPPVYQFPFTQTAAGYYQIGDQCSPAQSVFAAHDQRFKNWKSQGNIANQGDVNLFDASNDFTDYGNVNVQPTWKMLGTYSGCKDTLKTSNKENGSGTTPDSWYAGMDNYKEIDRARVMIPISGGYVHKIEYGGCAYNIADRINRGQNQNQFLEVAATEKSIMKINDIAGETICVVVSVVGSQLPGEVEDSGNLLKTMACAKGSCNVRVSEYEVVHPFYTSPKKSITQTSGQLMKLADGAQVVDILPMTQWTKPV